MKELKEPEKAHSLIGNILEKFKSPLRILTFLTSVGIIGGSYLIPRFINGGLGSWVQFLVEMCGWVLFVFSFRELSWRVEKNEYKIMIPLMITFSSVIFIYTSGRIIKDTLSNVGMGNENTMIAKVFVLLFSLVYQYIYAKFSKQASLSAIIYVAVIPIVLYFTIFTFVLHDGFQLRPQFLPSEKFITSMLTKSVGIMEILKKIIRPLLPIIAKWPITIYYILAEVFATMGLSVFVWTIINSQLVKTQAKRLLPVFMVVAQFATMFAGFLCDGQGKQIGTVIKLNTFVMIFLVIVLIINNYIFFKWSFKSSIGEEFTLGTDKPVLQKTSKPKGPFWETIKQNYIFLLVGMLTVSYGLSGMFLEQFWKKNVTKFSKFQLETLWQKFENTVITNDENGAKQLLLSKKMAIKDTAISTVKDLIAYGKPTKAIIAAKKNLQSSLYSGAYANSILTQAKIALVFSAILTNIFMEYISWTAFASFTPLSVLIGGLIIIGLPLLNKIFHFVSHPESLNYLITTYGAYIVAIFKTLKYGAFDPGKEEWILRRTDNERNQIKIIEGYLGRVGKFLGSVTLGGIIYIWKLLYNEDVELDHPFVSIVMFILTIGISIVWLSSVVILGKSLGEKKLEEPILLRPDNPEVKDSK